ncbi:MAG: hypothetical protein AB2693_06275, partial [Candidatus Thiodiazotropha sp.]
NPNDTHLNVVKEWQPSHVAVCINGMVLTRVISEDEPMVVAFQKEEQDDGCLLLTKTWTDDRRSVTAANDPFR